MKTPSRISWLLTVAALLAGRLGWGNRSTPFGLGFLRGMLFRYPLPAFDGPQGARE